MLYGVVYQFIVCSFDHSGPNRRTLAKLVNSAKHVPNAVCGTSYRPWP